VPGATTVIDVMYPDRMPIFFWREDLQGVRDHMAALWGGVDKCFDVAFANMTHGGGGRGYVHPYVGGRKPRWGFSQFNIIANYCFYWRPGRYTWHVGTVDMVSFNERLAFSLGAMEKTIFAQTKFVNTFPVGLEEYKATMTTEKTIAVGRNGVPLQHTIHYTCCRLYPELNCSLTTTWERARTLGYNPLEKVPNPAWMEDPSQAFEDYFAASELFVKNMPSAVRDSQRKCCAKQAEAHGSHSGVGFDFNRECRFAPVKNH